MTIFLSMLPRATLSDFPLLLIRATTKKKSTAATQTHTHTHIHTRALSHAHICADANTHSRTHALTEGTKNNGYWRMGAWISCVSHTKFANIHTHTNTHTHIHIHVYKHKHTHTHTHTNTHTYIDTYTNHPTTYQDIKSFHNKCLAHWGQ